jgi:hypothetical protein
VTEAVSPAFIELDAAIAPEEEPERKTSRKKSRCRRPYSALPRVGRPSRFRPELAQFASRLCLLGLTDQQLSDCLGISAETLYAWKISYPEFREAIARGKLEADALVAESLYRRAIGYEHERAQVFEGTPETGPIVVRYIEHLPPDVRAARLWLSNRQPGRWRERPKAEANHTLEQRLAQMTSEERRARLSELRAKAAAGPVIETKVNEIE